MQPLNGTKVLGFTQSVAGPVCTQQLAQLGADVVKIEPPWGDPGRNQVNGAQYAAFNQGVESLSIDLKMDRGRELTQKLAADADVIAENYRPGVMADYGLDYESVAEYNDDIVYCSISGFGESGPYREYAAYDPIIQAMSGLMSVTGHPDDKPVRIGTSAIDWTTGMSAAYSTLAGILNRNQNKEGVHVSVSMFDIAISWMSYWIALYTETGEVKKNVGNSLFETAPYGLYYAKDGPFMLCAGNTYMQFEQLCKTIDREDLLGDERYETRLGRVENKEDLREQLNATFGEYERDELMELLTESGVAAGPLQDVDTIVDEDPHVAQQNLLTENFNPTTGNELRIAGPPVLVNGTRLDFDHPPHEQGEDTVDILLEHGFTDEEIADMIEQGILNPEN